MLIRPILRSARRHRAALPGRTLCLLLVLLCCTALPLMAQPMSEMIGYRAVAKDAFPVFDNPELLSPAAAEAQGVIFERDAVIGVAHRGEAKAYPITIMGVHELGNDTIGGEPITVEW